MENNIRELAMEFIGKNASSIRAGKSDWSRISDLLILFMDEFPETKTVNDFIEWLSFDPEYWLNENTVWEQFFGVLKKGQIQEFIYNWINEEDIASFMDFIREKDEKLWQFLINTEISGDEYF